MMTPTPNTFTSPLPRLALQGGTAPVTLAGRTQRRSSLVPGTTPAIRAALWAAAAAAAVALAVAANSLLPSFSTQTVPSRGFAGGIPIPVQPIQHVKTSDSRSGLERVPCAGAARGVSSCWVAAP